MERNTADLAEREYDLVIVGGGIFGACAAWDATLRGLSVALVERDDFGAGASANSFKIVHGGIRYLQHADLIRLRSSCYERSAFLRIAPHLVQPLPIVIPTYGHGLDGKAFLGTGMYLYDLLTLDRNRGIKDPLRKIPWSRFFSRQEVLSLFPDLKEQGLTGAAMFRDAQMYNPTRLVLAFIASAVDAGAIVANHVEATGFLRTGDRIHGIEARDVLSGDEFTIRAKMVLNAAGPWAERLLQKGENTTLRPHGTYSRDACFVVARRPRNPYALAVQGQTRDPDAVVSRAARHLFVVPWRDYTLIGVWHVVYDGNPDEIAVSDDDLKSFIDEINWAYPSLQLSLEDVSMWNAGLVPFGENEPGAVNLSYGKRSHLIDHQKEHGIEGLVTLIGIRYTMGRGDAATALDLISAKLGNDLRRPPTHRLPLHGGRIENFEELVRKASKDETLSLKPGVVRALVHNYGTEYRDVLEQAKADPTLLTTLGESSVLRAEVLHAVRQEMALTLADVVFRRTDLATGANPGESVLQECAGLVAKELGWSAERANLELQRVRDRFPRSVGTSGPMENQHRANVPEQPESREIAGS